VFAAARRANPSCAVRSLALVWIEVGSRGELTVKCPCHFPAQSMFSLFKDKPANGDSKSTSPAESRSWLSRLKSGLSRTSAQWQSGLAGLWGRPQIDDAWFEALEDVLLQADVGPQSSARIIEQLKSRVVAQRITEPAALRTELANVLETLLQPLAEPLHTEGHKPFVIMIVGVNGAGKTTTIGKLARHFLNEGKTVMLAAGDTFRAAAREQLATWGERAGVTVISQEGADPAAVIFDAIQAASARGIDIVIADTAGRLPTQLHLMDELKKISRVITKAEASAPHEVLLVLDANTGQNAKAQVEAFDSALSVTGLVVTKLDGTARGGALVALAENRKSLPIRFIGVGEAAEDLQPFRADEFVRALIE